MGAALCFAKVCTREKGDQPSRRVTARIIARFAAPRHALSVAATFLR
jgi:hypothetical protein